MYFIGISIRYPVNNHLIDKNKRDDRQEQLAEMYQFYTAIRMFTACEEKKQYIDKLGSISLELGGHIMLFKLWHFQMRDSRCS